MTFSPAAKAASRWYLGVHCHRCLAPILFAVDHEVPLQENTPLSRKLILTCSSEKCRHRSDYTADKVLRFQKPPANEIEGKDENDKDRKQARRA